MVRRIYVAVVIALAAALIGPGVSAASVLRPSEEASQYKYVTVTLPGEVNTGVADINASGVYVGAGCDATCTNRVQFIATPQGTRTFYTIPFADFSPSAPYLPTQTAPGPRSTIHSLLTSAAEGPGPRTSAPTAR